MNRLIRKSLKSKKKLLNGSSKDAISTLSELKKDKEKVLTKDTLNLYKTETKNVSNFQTKSQASSRKMMEKEKI